MSTFRVRGNYLYRMIFLLELMNSSSQGNERYFRVGAMKGNNFH